MKLIFCVSLSLIVGNFFVNSDAVDVAEKLEKASGIFLDISCDRFSIFFLPFFIFFIRKNDLTKKISIFPVR